MRLRFLGEMRYPSSCMRVEMVSLRSSTDEFDEMKMPDSGLAGFWSASMGTERRAGDASGRERNSSCRRIEEGGVGGHVENQLCVSRSIDEKDAVEADAEGTDQGMLSVSEKSEVADKRLATNLGAGGIVSTRPSPASALTPSISSPTSCRML